MSDEENPVIASLERQCLALGPRGTADQMVALLDPDVEFESPWPDVSREKLASLLIYAAGQAFDIKGLAERIGQMEGQERADYEHLVDTMGRAIDQIWGRDVAGLDAQPDWTDRLASAARSIEIASGRRPRRRRR